MKKLCFVFCFLSTLCFSKTYDLKTGGLNKVEWTAIGNPGFLRINATGGQVEGKAEVKDGKLSGTFKVKLDDFDTGMGLRNRHMKEKYLETSKYPYAVLKMNGVAVKAGEFPFTATLKIKDETKLISGKAVLKGENLTAEFTVNIEDYPSVGVPSWLGVTMASQVEVTVKVKL